DLWVCGTNGYLRTFQGDALHHQAMGFRPEVQVCYEPTEGRIHLKLHNSGSLAGSVTVQPNAYRHDGPWTLQAAAGETATLHWDLADSGCWYDFTVRAEHFERRFAGRVETGAHGISDPAMALHLAT